MLGIGQAVNADADLFLQPVFQTQSGHTSEVVGIAADQSQSVRQTDRRDFQIIRPDDLGARFQFVPDGAVASGSFVVEWQRDKGWNKFCKAMSRRSRRSYLCAPCQSSAFTTEHSRISEGETRFSCCSMGPPGFLR